MKKPEKTQHLEVCASFSDFAGLPLSDVIVHMNERIARLRKGESNLTAHDLTVVDTEPFGLEPMYGVVYSIEVPNDKYEKQLAAYKAKKAKHYKTRRTVLEERLAKLDKERAAVVRSLAMEDGKP